MQVAYITVQPRAKAAVSTTMDWAVKPNMSVELIRQGRAIEVAS